MDGLPLIRIETVIGAPIERCFDLARDPDLHARSVAHTDERVVSRTGEGLLGMGDVVTFEARHFGLRQRLTARIARFEPPRLFEDQMVCGAFRSFRHVHAFEVTEAGTLMTDTFEYDAPLGLLGALAARLFLTRYLQRLLTGRAAYLKQYDEREQGTGGRSDAAP
jgi:ligand-binding SRPBCC domain-containing protein